MNRFRSTLALFPAGLLLLFAASCKSSSPEPQAAEPPSHASEDEPAAEDEPASEPAPDAEPEAQPASETDDSPAPPPPPPKATPAPSSADQEMGSKERLNAALSKDAETKDWGLEAYALSKEAPKPRIRDNYVFLLGGTRQLTDDAWEPVESQGNGGINYLGSGPGGWFHWDVAYSYGSDNGNIQNGDGTTTAVESTVWEIDFGITKMFAIGKVVRPYIGVGLAYVRAGGQITTATGPVDESDNSFGGYGRAGLAFDITKFGGLIGIDFRYVGGTSITIDSVDTNADGFVGSITFGYSW